MYHGTGHACIMIFNSVFHYSRFNKLMNFAVHVEMYLRQKHFQEIIGITQYFLITSDQVWFLASIMIQFL